jgi:hypothetical protein
MPCMSHSVICSTSNGWKKGHESNMQFDSRPRKVEKRPDPGVCRWGVTHHWKVLKESYKFSSDLIPIGGLNKELWTPKVSGVQTETILGLLLGSIGKNCHSDVSAASKRRECYMGEDGGFPQVQAMVSHVNLGSSVTYPSTENAFECDLTNLLVGLMQVQVTKQSLSLFLI